MSDDFKRVFDDRISRRDLLKRAGVGAGVLAIPGFLAACGGGGDYDYSRRRHNDLRAGGYSRPSLSVETPVGEITWAGAPIPNVQTIPIIDGQWVKGAKWPVEWNSTENANDPKVPVQAKLLPYA